MITVEFRGEIAPEDFKQAKPLYQPYRLSFVGIQNLLLTHRF